MKSVAEAWAAGFFDGEGWVGVGATSTAGGTYIRVYISQKHREVLDKFQEIVGVGKVNGPHKQGPKMMYAFQCSKYADVLHIWELLSPHLCPIKQKQFNDAFQKWESRSAKRRRV